MAPAQASAGDIVGKLGAIKSTVAVAESLTGGAVCSQLIGSPGASRVVRGGVVTYMADTKTSVLGVDADLIGQRGTVDPDVAQAMAAGVVELMGADIGVATTGVAGPGPSEGQAAGTCYVAVHAPWTTTVDKLELDGSRQDVRDGAVRAALAALARVLMNHPPAAP